MALHKFTPGGCRQDCGSSGVTVDCPCTPPCDAGTTRNAYTVQWNTPGGGPSGSGTFTYASEVGGGCRYTNGSTYSVCGVTCYGELYINGATAQFLLRRSSNNAMVVTYNFTTLLGTPDCSLNYALDPGLVPGIGCGNVPLTTASVTPNGTAEVDCIETPYTIPANPNSCCPCEDCRVFRDSLTEFTAAEPNANWTEVRGDWRIEYGALRSGDANALLVANASASGGYDWRCVVMPYAAGAAAEFNLVFGYVDSNNYFVARWTYAGSQSDSSGDTLHLFQVDGGVESELTYTAEINQGTYVGGAGFVFAVCVNESRTRVTAAVRGDANLPILLTSAEVTPADVGNQFGFGPVTGGARAYGRPEASVVSADCEQCAAYVTCDSISGIAPCEGSLSPAEMLVTLPGGWVQPAPVGGYTGNACCPQWSAASVVAEFTSSIMPYDYGLASDPTARWYCLWLYEERMTSGETADAMGCTSYPVDRFFVILIPESAGGGLFRWHAYVRMQNANHKYTDVAEFRSDTFTIGEFDCRSSFTLAKYTVADEHPGDSLWSGQSYCDGAMSSPLLVEPVT